MTAVEDQTAQPTGADQVIQILHDAGRPVTRAQIADHPACRDWSERVLFNVLRDAVDRGLARRSARGVYELTDADRDQLPAEPPL